MPEVMKAYMLNARALDDAHPWLAKVDYMLAALLSNNDVRVHLETRKG